MGDKVNGYASVDGAPDPRHQQAFELYWSLGPKRSYRRVAQRLGLSSSTIKLWSRQQGWQERITEREVEQSRKLADSVAAGPDPESVRNLKIVDMAILRIAKAIAEGKVRATHGDLDRMIGLKERLLGIHGFSPQRLAEVAQVMLEIDRMTVDDLIKEVRRVALDLGIVRKGDLVEPDDGRTRGAIPGP